MRYSFAKKLNFYILSSLTLLFLMGLTFFYHTASGYLERQAYHEISRQASEINLKVSHLIQLIEKIPENLSWILPVYVKEPDSIFRITRQIVQQNKEVFGCAIAFEPDFFPGKGKHFAPYSYMKGDSVITIQIGKNYDYYQKNWYKLAKEQNLPRWTQPYHEYASPDIITSTYSVPLRINGSVVGIFSVDLSLNWLKELIDSVKPYEDSYVIIINHEGRYILQNKNSHFSGKEENIFDLASALADSSLTNIAHKVTNGETGKGIFTDDKGKSYIFYSPVSGTDWYMATICPQKYIYKDLNYFNFIVFCTFILFLLIVCLLITITIRKITRPLRNFTLSAASIAEGKFNTSLPEIHSGDEMQELHDAFSEMQEKLSKYMNNLEITIAAKEKIESELRIAHDIQMSMLPKNFLAIPKNIPVELYAVLYPARQVGGDFYDFFILKDHLYFAIGDVSGKGIPASLLMSSTISLLRMLTSDIVSPEEIVRTLNNSIAERNETDMFVTFFIGMLNLKNGILKYCNAGHTPPILTKPDHSVSFFPIKNDLPLGIIKNHNYQEDTYYFTSGSGILLYTDGVTDSENYEHEFYTKERLLRMVRHYNKLHPQKFIKYILSDIETHKGNQEFSDDLTILTLIYGEEWNIKK